MKFTAIFFIATLPGCVSISTHERLVKEAYINGLRKARKIAYQQKCEDAVYLISGKIELLEIQMRRGDIQ